MRDCHSREPGSTPGTPVGWIVQWENNRLKTYICEFDSRFTHRACSSLVERPTCNRRAARSNRAKSIRGIGVIGSTIAFQAIRPSSNLGFRIGDVAQLDRAANFEWLMLRRLELLRLEFLMQGETCRFRVRVSASSCSCSTTEVYAPLKRLMWVQFPP